MAFVPSKSQIERNAAAKKNIDAQNAARAKAAANTPAAKAAAAKAAAAKKPVDYVSGSTKPGEKYTAWKTASGKAPDFGKPPSGPGTPYTTTQKTNPKKPPAWIPKPLPKPKPKPTKPKAKNQGNYVVQRGDNLSSIGKKYGVGWKDIYDYNLANRNKNAVSKIKGRGPNKIFKGSSFLIPNKDWRSDAIKRRLSK